MLKINNVVKALIVITISLVLNNINSAQQKDVVHGNLIQFNDNGLWCWYQDERAQVDTAGNKLILGSVASSAGVGNSVRNGDIEAVIFDLHDFTPQRYELAQMGPDDHNAPGIIIRPDGKYLAMYSAHYDYYKNRFRIFDGVSWSTEDAFDWETRPGGTNYTIAYNNIYYLSAENRMYDFSRANNRSPNFIVSDDWGDTWEFGGQLTTNTSDSYNKGYYKYWGNGVDRIDFFFTEQHPRDTLTSIYHGYIKDGKAYDSYDNIADDNIYDTSYIPAFWDFTKVFSNGTTIGTNTYYRCWQSDFVRYNDGVMAGIITARINQSYSGGYNNNPPNPDHAFFYCRFDGSNWNYTFLGKAGFKFYSSEEDYVGLGALHPDDPDVLYISTPFDPRDTTISFEKRELFKGITEDNGSTWSWTPITENSSKDNIRPIIPSWSKDKTALLWCRGSYYSAQTFDAAVVGIIDINDSDIAKKVYVDADASNTTRVDESNLGATGPDSLEGNTDNNWHIRTGIGNNNSVLTSAEMFSRQRPGENAPMLKSHIDLPANGIYDVWVNFWGSRENNSDWRIVSGLSKENMQLFRSMACQQVDSNQYDNDLIFNMGEDISLYQAYLGRVYNNRSFDVFINDSAYQVGTNNPTMRGDLNRTWYDGISYASVSEDAAVSVDEKNFIPLQYSLEQNYPNPFNPATTIKFTIPFDSHVTIKIYNILGQQITTLVNRYMSAGNNQINWNAENMSSGIYIYTIKAADFFDVKKMVYQK